MRQHAAAGPLGKLEVSRALACWHEAMSMSWADNRDDWTELLEIIDVLADHAPDLQAQSQITRAEDGYLVTKFLQIGVPSIC
jgi:hypothetical protein